MLAHLILKMTDLLLSLFLTDMLLNMLSRLVITFLPKSKRLLISWLQSPSAVILESRKIKSVTVSIVSPFICHEVMGPDAMILVFWMLRCKWTFSLSSLTFIKKLFSSSLSAISVVSSAYLRLLIFLSAILISFWIDWFDFAVQGTLKSLLQHHSSKASILWQSAFFIVQLSHPYMTTGKTIALTRRTFVDKVMYLIFNMLSRLVITFLPRRKFILISWLQSQSALILNPRKIKSVTVSIVS